MSATRRLWVESEDEKLREGVKQQKAVHGAVKDWNRVALAIPRRSNKDCRKRWSKISKDVKKGSWDAEEDVRLKDAVKSFGMRWTQIAEHVGTRHADQCAKRWTHSLDPNLNQSDWTREEDEILLAAVGERGRNWKEISETELLGRSKSAIKNRYSVVQKKGRDQSSSSSSSTSCRRAETNTSWGAKRKRTQSQQSPVPSLSLLQSPLQSPVARSSHPSTDNSMADSDEEENSLSPETMASHFDGILRNDIDQPFDQSWRSGSTMGYAADFYPSYPMSWNSFDSTYGRAGTTMTGADQQSTATSTNNYNMQCSQQSDLMAGGQYWCSMAAPFQLLGTANMMDDAAVSTLRLNVDSNKNHNNTNSASASASSTNSSHSSHSSHSSTTSTSTTSTNNYDVNMNAAERNWATNGMGLDAEFVAFQSSIKTEYFGY